MSLSTSARRFGLGADAVSLENSVATPPPQFLVFRSNVNWIVRSVA